jgi:hypothetical protein
MKQNDMARDRVIRQENTGSIELPDRQVSDSLKLHHHGVPHISILRCGKHKPNENFLIRPSA